jgi:hypothetical protein
MIYELIALACLVAHGDITTRKIRATWHPDKIIAELERLHSGFFPIPIFLEPETLPDGTRRFQMTERHDVEFLAKSELVKNWGQAGDYLHRGSFENLSLKPLRKIEFSGVRRARQKIENLLEQHNIWSREKKQNIICVMSGQNGMPLIFFASGRDR